MATILLVPTLLAGCATLDPGRVIQVAVHELNARDLALTCNSGERDYEPGLNGCFRQVGDVCRIYTLPRWVRADRDGDLSGYHRTLGHEFDHCAIGLFHGEALGVDLPRLPRR